MRHTTVVVAALVVLGTAGVSLGVAAAPAGDATTERAASAAVQEDDTAVNETDVSPGERLSGVVGVQAAELGGDLQRRALRARVANAASADAKAAVVGEAAGELRNRLSDLREEKERLQRAQENGSMSRGQYAARMAALAAETEAVRDIASSAAVESADLPDDVLAANGVNSTAIHSLRQDAADLAGSEVAAVAQTIAGPDVGQGPTVTQESPENGTDGSTTTEASTTIDTSTAINGSTATSDLTTVDPMSEV